MTNVSCMVCDSTQAYLMRTLNKSDPGGGSATQGSFRVWKCGECRFTWVDRMDLANPEAAAAYQDYPYNNNMFGYFEAMRSLYLRGLRERIARTLGNVDLRDRAFLDVGCANGEYLCAAKELGFGTVAGVEIDDVATNRARAYGEVCKDVRDLSCSHYDIIQINSVASNIIEFRPFVKKCLSVLNSHGFLLLDVLDQESISSRVKITGWPGIDASSRCGNLRPPYVINGFNKKSLAIFLCQLGLKPTLITTARHGSTMVPYPRSTNLLRRMLFLINKPVIISESAPAPQANKEVGTSGS